MECLLLVNKVTFEEEFVGVFIPPSMLWRLFIDIVFCVCYLVS